MFETDLSGVRRSKETRNIDLRKLLRERAVMSVAVGRVVRITRSVLTVRGSGEAVAVGADHG
jgi:hypothetical protein